MSNQYPPPPDPHQNPYGQQPDPQYGQQSGHQSGQEPPTAQEYARLHGQPYHEYGQQPQQYGQQYGQQQYGGQYGQQYGGRKPRPRGLWFLAPLTLLGLAILVGVMSVVGIVSAVFETDGEVPRDGQDHTLTLSDTDDRVLWEPQSMGAGLSSCTVRDQDGEEIALRSPDATYTRDAGRTPMRGAAVFTPTSTEIVVNCAADDGPPVEVGPFDTGKLIGGGIGVLAALGFGLVGVIWLIWLSILYFSRPPRTA